MRTLEAEVPFAEGMEALDNGQERTCAYQPRTTERRPVRDGVIIYLLQRKYRSNSIPTRCVCQLHQPNC